eukprot:1158747-Pelagomonas_calceolata.AAC.17
MSSASVDVPAALEAVRGCSRRLLRIQLLIGHDVAYNQHFSSSSATCMTCRHQMPALFQRGLFASQIAAKGACNRHPPVETRVRNLAQQWA